MSFQQRSSNTEFKAKVLDKHGDSYEVIGEYVRNNVPISMLHKTCGKEWQSLPMYILRPKNPATCPFCSSIKRRTTESFKEEVNQLTDGEYALASVFKTMKDKVIFKHIKCGKAYSTTPDVFMEGCRCPHCKGTPKKDTAQFVSEVLAKKGSDFKVLGQYIGTNDKIRMRHNCGYEWEATPNNLLNRDTGCPECMLKPTVSMRVKKIEQVLNSMNVRYEREVSFEGCDHKKPLRFDFFLPAHDLLIEYDGAQHFDSTFGNESRDERLWDTRLRDCIKNQWVQDNHIALLRIDYKTGDNLKSIPKIISGILNEERSTTIETYGLYYISEDSSLIADNGKYDPIE
jgi:very-short-patch-repair endonuclease